MRASLTVTSPLIRDGGGASTPINVNWDDAKNYTAWLSRKTGKTYRLLSEAEREYVTRAGITTPFWWGSSITPRRANYDGSAEPYKGGGAKGDYRWRTNPARDVSYLRGRLGDSTHGPSTRLSSTKSAIQSGHRAARSRASSLHRAASLGRSALWSPACPLPLLGGNKTA